MSDNTRNSSSNIEQGTDVKESKNDKNKITNVHNEIDDDIDFDADFEDGFEEE